VEVMRATATPAAAEPVIETALRWALVGGDA
jgi:hypothetical protein